MDWYEVVLEQQMLEQGDLLPNFPVPTFLNLPCPLESGQAQIEPQVTGVLVLSRPATSSCGM